MEVFCDECYFAMRGWCNICDQPFCKDCDRTCPYEEMHADHDEEHYELMQEAYGEP